MSIWFAIPVKPGLEQKAAALLQQSAQAAGVEEVFAPCALVERREHGRLTEQREALIPGYVMAIAPSKWELRKCLRAARGMDYLYADGVSFAEMRAEEVAFIERCARRRWRKTACTSIAARCRASSTWWKARPPARRACSWKPAWPERPWWRPWACAWRPRPIPPMKGGFNLWPNPHVPVAAASPERRAMPPQDASARVQPANDKPNGAFRVT
ncbi:MAG: transcription termination/antitermination NusG family protein [Coriobacteriaceae bacterium]|nr:transcription termination/antitermination NusG family protein [Coriobacteriaceae bacterium]